MREIKFRGKRIDNGEWVYGYYFQSPLTDENSGAKSEDGWFFLSGKIRYIISQDNVAYTVLPETVGQYTGLKDKNGKEIYEDDILDCIYKFDGCKKHKLKVVWLKDHGGFWLHNIGKCHQPNVRKTMSDMTRSKIIGNRHENPNLIKE